MKPNDKGFLVDLNSLHPAISAEEYFKRYNRIGMRNEVTFRNKTFFYSKRPEFWEHLGNWENESFDVLDKYLGPGKTFLDVGSWNGVLALYAEKLGAEVVCFEPDNAAYAELMENIQLNDSKIKAYNLAVTSQSGHVNLFNSSKEAFGDSMTSISTYKVREGESAHVQPALSTTLYDIAFIVKPDLVKLDAEGAEALILSHSIGPYQFLTSPIYLSVHPKILTEEEIKNLYFLLLRWYDLDMSLPEFTTNEKGILLTPIKNK